MTESVEASQTSSLQLYPFNHLPFLSLSGLLSNSSCRQHLTLRGNKPYSWQLLPLPHATEGVFPSQQLVKGSTCKKSTAIYRLK